MGSEMCIRDRDYTGSFEMGLYREDYERYKDLVTVGRVLYVEGIYNKGYSGDNYYFKLQEIRLMASLSQDLTKSLLVRIPLDKIDKAFVAEFKDLCATSVGKHSLSIQVMDDHEDMNVNFSVTGYKVSVDSYLINRIRRMGLSYKLN